MARKTPKQQSAVLEGIAADLKKLEAQLGKLENFVEVCRKINEKVCAQLLPIVKPMLLANYNKMNFGGPLKGGKENKRALTGALESAVANSDIRVGKKGLVIALGKGKPREVYISSSVFRRYRDFYKLEAGDMAKLQTEFTRLFQVELDKLKANK